MLRKILAGAASVLDFWPAPRRRLTVSEALERDWRRVGTYFDHKESARG